MASIELRPLDPRDALIAQAIHGVQMLAYAQEAELLGARVFPPLELSVQDIQAGRERFIGAWTQGSLVGALGLETERDGGITIASLVVLPAWQRRGIGRRLIAAALADLADREVRVSTGAQNPPALALYGAFGFVEQTRRRVGPERLEVIGLCRKPTRLKDARCS